MRKQKGGWDLVFTNGSSKIAYQQLTGGYGQWYGEGDERNKPFVVARDLGMKTTLIKGGNYEQPSLPFHSNQQGNPSIWWWIRNGCIRE